VLSAAEFDAILAAASNAKTGTSISDTPPFPVSCVAQELQHGAASVTDSRCRQHEGFAFNILVGHAFLLSTAAHSGLTCRCSMASWLLSQLSSMLLLFGHDAPSLNTYLYSITTFMLLSFFLCFSVSLWIGRDENIGGHFCTCFASESDGLSSFELEGLMSSSKVAETAVPDSDSECCESLQPMGDSIRIILDDGTVEPVSNLKSGQKVMALDTRLGQLVPTIVEELTENSDSADLVKIQCTSGVQATCPAGYSVLTQDDDVNYKEAMAVSLLSGAKVLVFNVSEETVADVTVQPASDASDGANPFNLTCKGGFLLAADRRFDTAIAIRPAFRNIDCWGPPNMQGSKFSSSVPTDTSSGCAIDLKLGSRLEPREIALSDFAQIPQGMDERLCSCGSRNHPHGGTPG